MHFLPRSTPPSGEPMVSYNLPAQRLPEEVDQPLLELLRIDRRRLHVLAVLREPGCHVHAGCLGGRGQLLGLVDSNPLVGPGVHDIDGTSTRLANGVQRVVGDEVVAADHSAHQDRARR